MLPHLAIDPALAAARRATLTTLDVRDGRPRSVPICFAIIDGAVYSPLDDKPKVSSDPTRLRRVRNVAADPRATILIDLWDEDWTRLAWVELNCHGTLLAAGSADHAAALIALRTKYPQYANHRLDGRPLLQLRVIDLTAWAAATRELPGA